MESTTPNRWWTAETVAVVTGASQGIGFEIVRKLAQEGITVVLTARDEGRGVKATNDVHAKGLKNVVFRKLDIGSAESVTEFVDWIKHTYGGLDILVNNGSVAYMDNEYKHAVETMDINYRGTVNLTEKLLPLFKPSPAGARIVIISSVAGKLIYLKTETLRQQFVDASKFDQNFLNGCAKKYEDACQAGEAADYFTAYFFSKVLQNAYTRLLAQRVAKRPEGKKIYVNCVHPGTVDSPMFQRYRKTLDDATFAQMEASGAFGDDGVIKEEEGADTPVWLALLPARGPSGLFWHNRKEFSYDV